MNEYICAWCDNPLSECDCILEFYHLDDCECEICTGQDDED